METNSPKSVCGIKPCADLIVFHIYCFLSNLNGFAFADIPLSNIYRIEDTMLPIAEVLTGGYGAYQKYDPCRFYWDYDQK